MRISYAWLGFIMTTFVVLAAAQSSPLEGLYDVSGTNPDGSRYEGDTAEVSIHHGAVYVLWRHGSGTESITGIGLQAGDQVAIAYKLQAQTTIVMQMVDADTLVGEWIMEGVEGRGTERWTRRKDD